MLEPFFGSGPQMWPPVPLPGLAFQPPPSSLLFQPPPSSLLTTLAMRRGQPQGPTNDQELEDFIFDALEFVPGAGDVEVRFENGRVTLTGTVQHKRVKRDVGEIAWAIPVVQDVQNNVTIVSRRRMRTAARDSEVAASAPGRKQA